MSESIIKKFQKLLKTHDIEAFIIPSNDEFMGEYVSDDAKRLEFITGFTGSNGVAIITTGKCAFFTDGRYLLQASLELDIKNFEIFDLALLKPWEWQKKNNIKNLGFDHFLHSEENIKKYENPIPLKNLVDILWKDKPVAKNSKIVLHDIKYSGESFEDKIEKIKLNISGDYLLLAAPDSICWLLNIRGNDIEFSPLVLCYAFVSKDGLIDVFIKNDTKILPKIANVLFHKMEKLEKFVDKISESAIELNISSAPYFFISKLKKIIRKEDPCQLLKACKNKVEIEGAIKAHILDAIAVCKFLYFIEKKRNISEIEAAQILLNFRRENELFQNESFATIAGYGENAAIIHYRATEKTNKNISDDNLFLVDSGGQYLCGTTDITRVVHLGNPLPSHIKYYTLVLKGHINLAEVVFPYGTSGAELNILARKDLWKEGLDFNHGTGHGVGSYLNVHEGPQRIGKNSYVSLQEGMIISNEPGFYLEGNFGIRIENLVYVKNHKDNFLKFKNLTLVPYEKKLIDKNMLTSEEIHSINAYHQSVFDILKKHIFDEQLLSWLSNKCQKL